MLKRAFLLLLLLAFSLPAGAFFHGGGSVAPPTSITIANFNGAGTAQLNQITHYDINGDVIDAHDGMDLQVGGTFYKYGTSYGCGFVINQASPFCGFKVYSSTDEKNWTPLGFLFDATTAFWQTRCAGTAAFGGCYDAHMVHNVANNNYVFWFNQGSGVTTSTPNSYFVLVCATPTSGCVKQTDPAGLAHTGNGDFGIAVDGSGNAWIDYTNYASGYHIYVQQLNAAYTDTAGATTDSGAIGEGTGAVFNGSQYYVVYGDQGCAYCNTSATYFVTASPPGGSYSSRVTLNSNSCGGQPKGINVIVANGQTTYLYNTDLWLSGAANQALANTYYQPLSFTGSAINAFSCNATVTISGLSLNPPAPPSPAPDQTSVGADVFYNYGFVNSSNWIMQTFVPTGTTLSKVVMPLGQNCAYITIVCTGAGIDHPLVVSIVTLDGSNNPVTTLGSVTVTSAQLSWSQTALTLTYNLTGLTPGAHYGIAVKGANTVNSIAVGIETATTSAYPAGVERYSLDGGSTWNTQATNALMFSMFQ